MSLEFRILGTLVVDNGGAAVPIPSRRQRALLALLLLRPNEVLPTERIARIVWPEQPPAHPDNAVQANVSRLRRALWNGGDGDAGCALSTCPGGYLLTLPEDRLDLARFEALAERARSSSAAGAPSLAAELLREAIALWRGKPLAELAGHPFFDQEVARLEELFLTAVEERIEAELGVGRHGLLVPELRTLVAEHPTRERLWASLMVALYRAGRQLEALDAYRKMRARLIGEFALEPGPRVKRLERAILTQDPSLDLSAATDARHAHVPLPAMIGRERDLAEVRELVLSREVRLVTLSGAGGIGKTRLARAVATDSQAAFSGGSAIVEAASATDEGALTLAIAEQLAVETGAEGGILGSVVAHLRRAPMLLVLDNVEQLLPDVGVLTKLLAGVPDLTLLVTSRFALRLTGEHEYVVPALEIPPLDADLDLASLRRYPAATLFLDRSQACRASFRPMPEDAPVVAQICSRLDGVPLALELAAACVKVLSPREILDRLDDSLSLLTRGRLDAPERQFTMRATVEWSFRLLGEAEQELLARLAVFAGGWTLASAEAVCGTGANGLSGLSRLLDANLVYRRDDASGTRFGMLEPVREFALERLDELADADELRRRHAAHYAGTLYGHMTSGRRAEYADIDAIARELGNLRAALAWSASDGQGGEGVLLACALASLCRVRGHIAEAREWLEQALAGGTDLPARTRAAALAELAGLAMFQDDFAAGEPLFLEVLELADREEISSRDVLLALSALAWLHASQGRTVTALEYSDRAYRIARQGDDLDLAYTLNHRALALAELGRLEEADATFGEALVRFRRRGALRGVVAALTNRSCVKICLGQLDEGEALIDECVELAGRHADAALHACAASNLAIAALLRGDLDRTVVTLEDALRRNEALVDRRGMIENLLVTGAAAGDVGELERGLALRAASLRLHDEIGFQITPSERLLIAAYLEPALEAAEVDVAQRAESLAAGLDLADAVAYARETLAAVVARPPRPRVDQTQVCELPPGAR